MARAAQLALPQGDSSLPIYVIEVVFQLLCLGKVAIGQVLKFFSISEKFG